ncbi:hypothetical protein H4582DRAFT_2198255 [Lactarius indigo]|nr:hypothetical protein H4582DRAFT_2198255 [Lactarius indigo]
MYYFGDLGNRFGRPYAVYLRPHEMATTEGRYRSRCVSDRETMCYGLSKERIKHEDRDQAQAHDDDTDCAHSNYTIFIFNPKLSYLKPNVPPQARVGEGMGAIPLIEGGYVSACTTGQSSFIWGQNPEAQASDENQTYLTPAGFWVNSPCRACGTELLGETKEKSHMTYPISSRTRRAEFKTAGTRASSVEQGGWITVHENVELLRAYLTAAVWATCSVTTKTYSTVPLPSPRQPWTAIRPPPNERF